jgi:glycosyltransferase involved in cell wall biosynthesis
MRVRTLSVAVPVYNERATVYEILSRVLAVRLPDGIDKQILVVNDASTDDSRAEIDRFLADHPGAPVRAVTHDGNQGKGGAVHTAIAQAEGDYLVVQDADLELDPRDYNLLLAPVLEGRAEVVYGSRFLHGRPSSTLLHRLANAFLTGLSNLVLGTRLTDMETCYKLVPTAALRELGLQEKRFGFEPEVTARLARRRVRFAEVPIAFTPRSETQGKKIGWRDGFRAIYCIVKYGWFSGTRLTGVRGAEDAAEGGPAGPPAISGGHEVGGRDRIQ